MNEPQDIAVRVIEDGRRAQVHIAHGADSATLTPSLLRILASGAGLQITAEVEQRLSAVVDDFRSTPRDLVADIARASEPINGQDGAWTWQPGIDPTDAATAIASNETRTDHYASRIANVASGTAVAKLMKPTGGSDGRSVTGAVLKARPGKAAHLCAGEGLRVLPDGVVVAAIDGVLRIAAETVSVSPVLEVKGCVDFSTGEIDFKGDVVVADAVRDGFRIRATGNILINGPVEGATIECMGGLTCPRGVASGRRARIVAEGDSNIGYLRNVSAVFRGSLSCRGELEHSEVTVGGEFHCESGRVIGGALALTGSSHIGTLGSPDWTPTIVRVGDLPLVAMKLQDLGAEAARTQASIAAREESIRHLQACGGTKSAGAREQLTEMQYELSELRRESAAIEGARATLVAALRQGGQADLQVVRTVFPRVRIECGGRIFEFDRELKGPLRFLVDEHKLILVRISTQSPRPITEFARPTNPIPAPPGSVETARASAGEPGMRDAGVTS